MYIEVETLSIPTLIEQLNIFLKDESLLSWVDTKINLQNLINHGALELVPYLDLNIPWEWNEICSEKYHWDPLSIASWIANNEEAAIQYKHYLAILKMFEYLGLLKETTATADDSTFTDLFIHERICPVDDSAVKDSRLYGAELLDQEMLRIDDKYIAESPISPIYQSPDSDSDYNNSEQEYLFYAELEDSLLESEYDACQ